MTVGPEALVERAVAARERGDHRAARRLAGVAVDALRGPACDPASLAEALIVLAQACLDLADYATPERLFAECLDIARALPRGPRTGRLVVSGLLGLGNLLRMRGRHAEAERVLAEGLAVAIERIGPDDFQVAEALNALAIACRYRGRFDEAALMHRRALAIAERAVGREHPFVATLLGNLGGLGHARGDHAAERPARRAMEIRARALGSDHLEVATDRAALAAVLDARGRHREAEDTLRQALSVFERVLGPDHYVVAVTLDKLAAIVERAGDPAQAAAALYERALAIKRRLLGGDHPDVAVTLSDLGALHLSAGRFEESDAAFSGALAIFERALDHTHPSLAACRENRERARAGRRR